MHQENELIKSLIADMERYMGRRLQTPNDFQQLIDMLPKENKLSMSTIKRLWQYVPNDYKTRETTLNILTNVLGYRNWQDYCAQHSCSLESDFLTGLNTQRDVPVGTRLMLRWSPDRECLIEKRESGRFRVIATKNSKLQAGDEFYTAWIEKGKPLIATQFIRNNMTLPDYVAGRRNGITSVTHDPPPGSPKGGGPASSAG